MNFRKHLAGFAIFSVILGSAILINNFLTMPVATIPPVLSQEAAPVIIKEPQQQQPITYRVRQVSIDYMNKKSYTELSLEREPDQFMPEAIWVKTTYFLPDSTRTEDWTTLTKISEPFAKGDHAIVVAVSDWDFPPASNKDTPGLFARIYVSSESSDNNSYSPVVKFSPDIAVAVPVVLHWPDEKRDSAMTAKKFVR
jgi:hypothetical protein